MQTISIRYNKKKFLLLVSLMILPILGMNYYMFGYKKIQVESTAGYLSLGLLLFVFLTFYRPLKRMLLKKPVLVFSPTGIELDHRGRLVFYAWREISSWYIKKVETSYTLTLVIEGKKKQVPLGVLEKKHEEIEQLMRDYKKTEPDMG